VPPRRSRSGGRSRCDRFVGIGIFKGGEDKVGEVGAHLRRGNVGHGLPPHGGGFGAAQPAYLRIGQQDLAVLRRAQDINADAHGDARDKGGAVGVRTAVILGRDRLAGLPVHSETVEPEMIDAGLSRKAARRPPAAVIGPQQADAMARAGTAAIIATTVRREMLI